MKLEFPQIRLDGGTQPRVSLRADVIDDYAELMKAGTPFDPITVYFDGSQYWLADGFHRLTALCKAFPGQPIEADVVNGSLADAQWFSYGANKNHGLRRTNEDKERAVRKALEHPKATTLSNVQIAEHCGVNEVTIRRYRKDLDASSTMPKMRTVTRRGKAYKQDVSKIGKHKKHARGPRKISPDAAKPVLAHSLPNPMIALSLPTGNAVMAAATIFKLFDPHFVRTLVAELAQRLKGLDNE